MGTASDSACKPAFGSSWGGLAVGEGCSAQRPQRPEAESSTAPAIGQPGPDLPGLELYCPMKWQAAGVCPDIPGCLPRPSCARAFPLGLGLSSGLLGGEVLAGAVSTLQLPRGQRPLSERRGEQRGGCPSPLWPSCLRAVMRARGPLCS